MNDMLNSTMVDDKSRARIVSETNKSFFVEAGAGSGKTTMLVNRMVAMVESGIDIKEISAITFTKAAAAEFYRRFQKVLRERSESSAPRDKESAPGDLPAPTPDTMRRCASALINIDLCFMGTIDAFCQKILSEHPAEAALPADTTVLSDEDLSKAYLQQYYKICSGEYGSSLKELSLEFRKLHKNPEEAFVRGISEIMGNRNATFRFEQTDAVDIQEKYKKERYDLIRIVRFLVDNPDLRINKSKEDKKVWDNINSIFNAVNSNWILAFPNLIKKLNDLNKARLEQDAAAVLDDELKKYFDFSGSKPRLYKCHTGELVDALEEYRYGFSLSFLMKCVPVIEESLKNSGEMSFFDSLYFLRNMLKKDAEGKGKLINYIASRHKYFLIDEFQDTNPVQAEIFFYLSATKPDADWENCLLRPGALFIVGDPKQSIYRFRGADETAFLKVKELFERNGGESLVLSRNFRSTAKLCGYFNSVFPGLLKKESENSTGFSTIPLPEENENEFTGIFKYETPENSTDADGIQIISIIKSLVGRNEIKIADRRTKSLRTIRYGDFMVIEKDKKNIGNIIKCMNNEGVPFIVEGANPFSEHPIISDLANIISAVADTDNEIDLHAALTGKIIGLTDNEISHFRSEAGSLSLKKQLPETVTDSKADRVLKHMISLKKLKDESRVLSPSSLMSRIIDSYRPVTVCNVKRLDAVYYALELLRDAEQTGTVISMTDASNYLKNLMGGNEKERCLSLSDNSDCVHLANLHKVKGLEAPVVILCAAKPKNPPPNIRIDYTSERPEGYVFSLKSSSGYNECLFQTNRFTDEFDLEKNAQEKEGDRLLYVAATRAQNALIIWNAPKVLSKGETKNYSVWSRLIENDTPDISTVLTTDDSPAGAAESSSLTATELYDRAERESVLKTGRIRETASFKTANPSRQRVLSKYSEEQKAEIDSPDGADELSDDVAIAKTTSVSLVPAALTGTAVHRLMELLVVSGARINVQEAIGGILDEFLTNETEVLREALRATLRDVADVIARGGYEQSNGAPKDILTTLLGAEEVYCELPFCYKEESGADSVIWNGIMDVVYLANGRWHIVDYKTNADGSDLDRKYSAQLTAYEKAFESITGFKADALIYHIDK